MEHGGKDDTMRHKRAFGDTLSVLDELELAFRLVYMEYSLTRIPKHSIRSASARYQKFPELIK
jgi:hypothetical protein